MRPLYRLGISLAALSAPSSAWSGEIPLYQPAPDWVTVASLPAVAAADADSPALALIDMQQRIDHGQLFAYSDTATRVTSPEMLAQLATLTLPWAPDKGDLIVHELSIVRGDKRIDLLANGRKLEVLRREQALEQLELTGILTATMAIEGLQVGDVLRLRATVTARDDALGGRVQTLAPILAAPARVGLASLKLSWPTAEAPRWKVHAQGVESKPVQKGAYTELAFLLPAPKQPEMPEDAPARFRQPPFVELSTFADWADVSKTMAPLYETKGKIAAASPLAAEVAAITKAEADPLRRTALALQLVQDKVRYLAVRMNGGNYVPQAPAKTWELRYGDCKAKTLLLLAVLHEMGIEAEAVAVSADLGDFVPERLPSLAAFNHVLVRATIGSDILWLDGTASGSRFEDLRDAPPFRNALPIRAAGTNLVTIPARAHARPIIDLAVEVDESTSVDLPSAFEATAVLRGAPGAMLAMVKARVGEKEQREAVRGFFQGLLGQAQVASATIMSNPAAGTVTLTARGVVTTPWRFEDRRHRRVLAQGLRELQFSADRSRPSWSAIPVATMQPFGMRYRLRVRLPDGGRGYALEGQPDRTVVVAGMQTQRSARLEGGIATVDERIETTGAEIAPGELAAERDRVTSEKALLPTILAPADARRRWEIGGTDTAGATQIKSIDAVLAKAIANDPEDGAGYTSRASFRSGIGDLKGALADLSRAIELAPAHDLYLQRATLHYELGDIKAAEVDAEAARKLDPGSMAAITRVSSYRAERGDVDGAAALLDERIALGGDTRWAYQEEKASLIGEFGDPAEALKMYDALIEEKPAMPSLLNGRCWVKATRAVMIDTALKDCTSAIELSSNTNAALDSRALVWFRMGRYEESLRDLDAVLKATPNQAASRYLRSVVLASLGRAGDAEKDLAIAQRLSPQIAKTYERFGVRANVAKGSNAPR